MNHTYQKNKILCVLQVRGGSKGVPKKNIRKVNGKPLMTWTIESTKSGVFDSIWVSSDSDEILEVGREEEVNTIKRPEELSIGQFYQLILYIGQSMRLKDYMELNMIM